MNAWTTILWANLTHFWLQRLENGNVIVIPAEQAQPTCNGGVIFISDDHDHIWQTDSILCITSCEDDDDAVAGR